MSGENRQKNSSSKHLVSGQLLKSSVSELATRDVNQCYANSWEDMIEVFKPDLWVHGHIHQRSNDYYIGQTRIVSNPYGYANSKMNQDWQEECVVKI